MFFTPNLEFSFHIHIQLIIFNLNFLTQTEDWKLLLQSGYCETPPQITTWVYTAHEILVWCLSVA